MEVVSRHKIKNKSGIDKEKRQKSAAKYPKRIKIRRQGQGKGKEKAFPRKMERRG